MATMMLLNTAVAREIDAELKRQELKPLALAIALSVSDRKASALLHGRDVWTMAQLEVASEMLGIGLGVLLVRCANRLGHVPAAPE